jgi:thioredoxin-like negative regulator of GroEL
VDTSKKLVKEMKIRSVPYLALYNNGKPVYIKNGLTARDELEKAFQQNIKGL